MSRDLVADFRYWLKTNGYRPNTIRAYLKVASKFAERFDPLSASKADVSEFLASLRASPSTTRQALSALSTFFSFLIERELREDNPAQTVRRPKVPKSLPTVLTEEEVESLLAAADEDLRDSVAVRLGYFAALRVSELCSLRWEDVDLRRPVLVVRGGKGGKDAVVPYGDEETLRRLREWRRVNRSDRVFPYSPRTAERIVKRRAEQAGIKKEVSYHTLRHSRATHLATQMDPFSLKEFMRHESLMSTQRYVHVRLTA